MFRHAGFLVVKIYGRRIVFGNQLCGRATRERNGLCECRSELKNIYNKLKLVVNA